MTNLSLPQAAENLGVGTSTLKRFCRKMGISRWPKLAGSPGPTVLRPKLPGSPGPTVLSYDELVIRVESYNLGYKNKTSKQKCRSWRARIGPIQDDNPLEIISENQANVTNQPQSYRNKRAHSRARIGRIEQAFEDAPLVF